MKVDNLPQKWNLYEFTGLPYFNNWPEAAGINKFYEERKSEYDGIRGEMMNAEVLLGSYIVLPLGGLRLLGYILFGGGQIGFLVTLCLTIISARFVIIERKRQKRETVARASRDRAAADRQRAMYNHVDIFIQPLANKLMSGSYRSYRTGTQCIIYGDDGFIYFNTHDSMLVAYSKSNIKDVVRERVHLGASTTSQVSSHTSTYGYYTEGVGAIYGGSNTSSTGHSETKEHYEWHLDIFTDFMDYPKVSLVLADTPSTKDAIGKIYAVLKP